MDRNVAGLLGAMGVLAATVPAHAATSAPLAVDDSMQVTSYSDLLKPIPNALALMKAASAAGNEPGSSGPAFEPEATVQDVQFHHHHHHRYRRRRYHHHHHHHHHQTY
jgi:hypothetical protein